MGAATSGQLTTAGKKVCMDVSFRGCRYAQAMGGGQPHVAIDVASGVEHDGFPGLLTSNEIGRVRECLVIDQTEQHVSCSCHLAGDSIGPRRPMSALGNGETRT